MCTFQKSFLENIFGSAGIILPGVSRCGFFLCSLVVSSGAVPPRCRTLLSPLSIMPSPGKTFSRTIVAKLLCRPLDTSPSPGIQGWCPQITGNISPSHGAAGYRDIFLLRPSRPSFFGSNKKHGPDRDPSTIEGSSRWPGQVETTPSAGQGGLDEKGKKSQGQRSPRAVISSR